MKALIQNRPIMQKLTISIHKGSQGLLLPLDYFIIISESNRPTWSYSIGLLNFILIQVGWQVTALHSPITQGPFGSEGR